MGEPMFGSGGALLLGGVVEGEFNETRLLERHGYRTPRQARDTLRQTAVA